MRKIYFYFLFAALLFSVACTKTVNLDPVAQNKITSYKVINLPDTVIYGVIDNIENTVTVYVPYYYGMDVIQPKITLEANAKLSEAALPVSITETAKTYTVTGADGTARVYKLQIVQQNTPGLTLKWTDNSPVAYPSELLSVITGNFLSKSAATLKIELTSQTGTTITPVIGTTPINTAASTYGDTYSLDGITLPVSLDSGSYKVKISYLGHTVTMDKPLHILYREPVVAPIWDTKTVAQGGSLTFIPSASLFINLKSVKATIQGKTYDLVIQSSSREQAVIKLPDDFPAGDSGIVSFAFQFGNWEPAISEVPLIVTAK